MNFITLNKFNLLPAISRTFIRNIAISGVRRSEATENLDESEAKTEEKIDPAIDRTKVIPVETSIRYLKSTAYNTTYGDQPVWVPYRRNFKGQHPPHKTRKTCVRAGKISTGNPCPICRDEYLVLDHNNVELLNQFISKHTGEVNSLNIIHINGGSINLFCRSSVTQRPGCVRRSIYSC